MQVAIMVWLIWISMFHFSIKKIWHLLFFAINILTITSSFLNEIRKIFLPKWSAEKALQALIRKKISWILCEFLGGVSKDWGIGIPAQFPNISSNAKIKKIQYPRYFLLLHSFSSRNLWTWMYEYENYFKKSIILTFMNGGTVIEIMVNSHFPEELS